MAKQFIGDKEISTLKDGIVTFNDGTTSEYTEKQLSYLVTEEAKDLSAMRELVLENVVPDILKEIQDSLLEDDTMAISAKILNVIETHNIRRGDFASVMDTVLFKFKEILDTTVKSYGELFSRAVGKAFGTYQE